MDRGGPSLCQAREGGPVLAGICLCHQDGIGFVTPTSCSGGSNPERAGRKQGRSWILFTGLWCSLGKYGQSLPSWTLEKKAPWEWTRHPEAYAKQGHQIQSEPSCRTEEGVGALSQARGRLSQQEDLVCNKRPAGPRATPRPGATQLGHCASIAARRACRQAGRRGRPSSSRSRAGVA